MGVFNYNGKANAIDSSPATSSNDTSIATTNWVQTKITEEANARIAGIAKENRNSNCPGCYAACSGTCASACNTGCSSGCGFGCSAGCSGGCNSGCGSGCCSDSVW